MKKVGWIGGIVVLCALIVAIVMAGQMGETSPAYARGQVILDDSVKDAAASVQTLFVIMSGSERPMPLGALRHTLSKAPGSGPIYEFVLTPESMQMMGGPEVPERFKLKARLDQDGTAGPDQPGDLVGEVLGVERGSKDVRIVINRVIP